MVTAAMLKVYYPVGVSISPSPYVPLYDCPLQDIFNEFLELHNLLPPPFRPKRWVLRLEQARKIWLLLTQLILQLLKFT